jgi:tetratricopeptide (TPR) repeat protein
MPTPPKKPTVNNLESTQIQVTAFTQEGLRLHQQGNFDEAQAIYEKILHIQPDHFDALQLLGVLFAQVKKYVQAVELLSKALEINPNHAGAYSNRGNALKDLRQFNEALVNYDQAIAIDPGHVGAHSNRGIALKELKRFDEALVSYDQAIMLKPDYVDGYTNRGNVLQDLKRPDEALASYDQAIIFNPNHAGTFANRGITLQGLKRFDEALVSYEQALRINPDLVTAHYNLSLFNLMRGNFKVGWQGYEWRWLNKEFDSEPLKSTKPAWDYQKTNQRLLVWAEQGIGDHIFFGSLLPELLADVPNLLVQIDKRLIPIFSRSLPTIKFYPDDIKLPESDYDVHVPIGSLGKYLRNDEKDFLQTKNKFLISDKTKTQTIRQDLSVTKKLICGISWKSQNEKTGAGRSLSLERLTTIFDTKKISLVNLQYGDISEDINLLKFNSNVDLIQYEPVDNFNDLDGFASLIDACDFIITTDNSTIHLSSALGKKSFLLLPFVAEWRWSLDGADSLWYPSTRLYRQEKINDWDSVLQKLKTEIKMIGKLS